MPTEAYDPLDYQNLAQSVVAALFRQPLSPLPPVEEVIGAGVYAIYYRGDFPPYGPISGPNCETPIYVGCAMPTGGRKGADLTAPSEGSELLARLRQHASSIEQARNLGLGDFACRYLVVVPVWIRLAERFLISHYRPVWNVAVDGFGNHDPGAGRSGSRRPPWDILHPGRPWAERLRGGETREEITERLCTALGRGSDA